MLEKAVQMRWCFKRGRARARMGVRKPPRGARCGQPRNAKCDPARAGRGGPPASPRPPLPLPPSPPPSCPSAFRRLSFALSARLSASAPRAAAALFPSRGAERSLSNRIVRKENRGSRGGARAPEGRRRQRAGGVGCGTKCRGREREEREGEETRGRKGGGGKKAERGGAWGENGGKGKGGEMGGCRWDQHGAELLEN